MTISFGTDKPFHELTEYPDLETIQHNYPQIQNELLSNKVWLNWGSDNYDQSGHCEFLTGDWTVCPIFFGNYSGEDMNAQGLNKLQMIELLATLPSRFPDTIAILKKIPRINYAAFSRLHPKSKLAPHKHKNPLCLIFHMGIIIPAGKLCGLKVGNETHLWRKPGEVVIFNDNFEHSAWNESEEERIILYIDFLRYL